MNAKTAIILDKRRQKQNGSYPVKLRVTLGKEQKYYTTPFSLPEPEFEKVTGAKPRNEYKEISLRLQAIEQRASDIIDKMPSFSWQLFEKSYHTNRAALKTIFDAFDAYAAKLRGEDRIGTAVSYECAGGSLKRFAPKARFEDVTVEFLQKYEAWMLQQECSPTTVGIYLRSLRTLFNNAIADGTLNKEYYPFGKRKYEIPTAQNVKKALTTADISKIYYHPLPEQSTEAAMRDYWMFMYFCNGINVKDFSLLKYSNLKGDVLEFQRAKTIRTKRVIEPIRVILNEDALAIIERRGNKQGRDGGYIFPVLATGLTPERERQLIQQQTQLINTHMKALARTLEIGATVTTYTARHSFATVLKRSNVSTEFISEALGHSNLRTTQSYLAGFEDESKREVTKLLTAFKS